MPPSTPATSQQAAVTERHRSEPTPPSGGKPQAAAPAVERLQPNDRAGEHPGPGRMAIDATAVICALIGVIGVLVVSLLGYGVHNMNSRFDDQNAVINTRFDDLDERLDVVESDIKGLRQAINDTNARINDLNARIDGLEARIDGTNARIDALIALLEAMEVIPRGAVPRGAVS